MVVIVRLAMTRHFVQDFGDDSTHKKQRSTFPRYDRYRPIKCIAKLMSTKYKINQNWLKDCQ